MNTRLLLSLSLAVALSALGPRQTAAAPLVLADVPAAQAAAQIGARYGADIQLSADAGRRVRLAVADADDRGTRVQTVNALANALGLDFTKTIVVRRAAGGEAPGAAVDSEASLPFGRTTLPAREAITLIAGVDGAFAKIADGVGGTVTLSKPTLTAAQAEAEVARQTGTVWKAVYVLAPRVQVSWVPAPLLVFPNRQREAQERRDAEAAERAAEKWAADQAAAYQKVAAQQAQAAGAGQGLGFAGRGMNGQGMNGQTANGYYPNGYGYGGYGSAYPQGAYGAYSPADAYGSGYGYGSAYGYGDNAVTSGSASFPSYTVGGGY